MIHLKWEDKPTGRKVECISNVAKKYKVNNMLTVGSKYDVINETDEFIFIIDNSDRVAGFVKEYFKQI